MSIRLYTGNTVESLWEPALLRWFAGNARGAWSGTKPVIVLTPGHSVAALLRRRAAEAGVPVFAVRFMGPDDLREFLRGHAGMPERIADDDYLRAVLRTVATDVSRERPSDAVARSLSRSPEMLFETIEALEGGGWEYERVPGATMRVVADRYLAQLESARVTSSRRFDFLAARRLKKTAPCIASILQVGFGSQHWHLWPLLKTAAQVSDSAVICLSQMTFKGEEAELVFRNSWEEIAAETIDAELATGSLAEFSAYFDRHGPARERPVTVPQSVMVLAAENQMGEARVAAHRAAQLVAEGAASVAVLVPGGGVLAREISGHLNGLAVPHFTSVPARQGILDGVPGWSALFELQSEPNSSNLSALLKLLPSLPESISSESPAALSRSLDRFVGDNLFPDIGIVRDLLASKAAADAHYMALATLLKDWPIWPRRATANDFLALTAEIAKKLEWSEVTAVLRDWRRDMRHIGELALERDAFCSWFTLAAQERRSLRTPLQAHPYAKVQILTPAEAVGRNWDHVVFTGQNEGIWPPPLRPGGYLSQADREKLNDSIRSLNARAVKQGSAGEGSVVVCDGHAFVVPPFHGRSLVYRDFVQVVEAANGLTIMCSVEDSANSGQELQPGDFLSRTYFLLTGENVNREVMEQLAITGEGRVPEKFIDSTFCLKGVDKMLHARSQRETSTLTEYDFSMDTRPDWHIYVPPSSWGKALSRPAEVFLSHVVGVKASLAEEERMPFGKVMGIWIHQWVNVAAASGKGVTPKPDAWLRLVDDAAVAARERVADALAANQRNVPAWWESVWRQARGAAADFAGVLAAAQLPPYVLAEAALPKTVVTLRSGRGIAVGGQLDLVFSDRPVQSLSDIHGARVWIVDLKSGADKILSAKSLPRYDGIQVGLYGLAAMALGAASVNMSVARADFPLAPQLSQDDLNVAMPVFEKLADMVDLGRFGWHGAVHNSFSRGVTYPIATLPAAAATIERFRVAHGL